MPQPLTIVRNRPALAALSYRIGTYAEFKRLLVDGLADRSRPALARLTTRDPSDFTLALLDAWACVADVITFYQERLADEAYLRTCTELLSVRELARAIGYAPGPGLAAAALLTFTLDDGPGAATSVRVEPGLKVMSVPGPGEAAMTFETVEALDLRPAWNAIPCAATTAVHAFRSELRLATVDARLAPGDLLLLLDDNSEPDGHAPGVRVVALDDVRVDASAGLTRVAWSGFGFHPRGGRLRAFALRGRARAVAELENEAGETDQNLRFAAPIALRDEGPRLVVVGDGTHLDVYPHFGLDGAGDRLGVDTGGRVPLSRFDPAALRVHFATDPLPLAPAPLRVDDDLHVKAPPPSLAEGDALLVTDAAGERWALAVAGSVRRDLSRGTMIISPRWTAGAGARLVPGDDLRVQVLRQRAPLFGHNAPDPQLVPLAYDRNIHRNAVAVKIATFIGGKEQVVDALRFAPPPGAAAGDPAQPSVFWTLTHVDDRAIDLAFVAPQIQPGAAVVLLDGPRVALYTADDVATVRRQDFTLDAACTRVTPRPAGPREPSTFPLAGTSALYGAEPLTLADVPLAEGVGGDELLIPGDLPALPVGRVVVVTGDTLTNPAPVAETVRVVEVAHAGAHTRVRVSPPLSHEYRRASLRVRANAVRATHGETVEEVLGSGDATRAFQRFDLAHAPLTYLSAATAAGRRSTLELRVGGLLWHPRDTLDDAGPTDRVYTVQVDPNGRTFVQFGDGVRGARLPTGAGNVRVTYRKGIGLEGQVRRDTLTLPLTRPPGVRAVTNPLPAAGAADPETLEGARRNATRSVIALGRVVSLRDYEDFARAFAGVARAQATQVGKSRVALTVAGPRGAQVLPGSDLFVHLRDALRAAGDPTVTVSLHGFDDVRFVLGGTVRAAADVLPDELRAALAAALARRFGFDARDFAAPVYLSEVVAAIQTVPGVLAVDLDVFARAGDPPAKAPPAALFARAFNPRTAARTELLTLADDGLSGLEVIA